MQGMVFEGQGLSFPGTSQYMNPGPCWREQGGGQYRDVVKGQSMKVLSSRERDTVLTGKGESLQAVSYGGL